MTSSPKGLQGSEWSCDSSHNDLLQSGSLVEKVLTHHRSKSFLARNDIGIILINQFIAEMIRHAIDAHVQSIPAVLEIPSKEHPYDASKDSILRRAKGMFSAEDFR
ncbi:V-type proton ATPase subunit F [Oryzias melastigma]|uniref:V-ATPase 14 kDa subunit n=1 Tax=Oryzias melastigma TaxID=30732 RepID=A0A834C0A4_ORYME|nr:V-type proton ATPase subunit F [Oryzias melastigma]